MPNFDLLLGSERAAWLADRAKSRGSSIAVELRRLIDERVASVTESNNPIGFAADFQEERTIGGNLKEGGKERGATSPQLRSLLLPETSSRAKRILNVGDRESREKEPSRGTNLVPSPRKDTRRYGYSEDFEAFWKRYPPRRRLGKCKVWKSWQLALRDGATAEQIIAGIDRSLKFWARTGVKVEFIPLALTWVNQGRWEDEYEDDQNAKIARHLLTTSDYRQAERAVAELALPPEEHVAWLDKIRAAKGSDELDRIVKQATERTHAAP